eukprot:scaffold37708_cov56-Phaeocystis_antarctica.AAC.1
MEIRPPGFLVRGWSQELNGSARCSGDAAGCAPSHLNCISGGLGRQGAQVRGRAARVRHGLGEERLLVGEEDGGRVELRELALVEDHDLRRFHDGVQPVRD